MHSSLSLGSLESTASHIVRLENILNKTIQNYHAAFDCFVQKIKFSGGGRSVFPGHFQDFGVAVEHPRELQAATVSVGPGALAHSELRRVQTRVALHDVENVNKAGVGSSENAHL